MSNNPLTKLKALISPSAATFGIVTEITSDIVKVATSMGLVEYTNPGGLVIGDSVNIKNSQIFKRTEGSIYWL